MPWKTRRSASFGRFVGAGATPLSAKYCGGVENTAFR
jgi:hypothetical protein